MRNWSTVVSIVGAVLIVAAPAHPVLAQGQALGEGPQVLIQAVAAVLDLPVEYLLARLRSGDTLATIASERGVGREALVVGTAGWVAGASYVQQLLGGVTGQEVRARVERTRGGLSENLDRPFPTVSPVLPRTLLQDAADLLYLQPQELSQQLQAGQRTVGEIAASEGLSRDDVISYLVEQLEERLMDGARRGAFSPEAVPPIVAAARPAIERFVDTPLAPARPQ
jgi:hypothetical protein